MLERADAVLAAIPLLAASGLTLRLLIAVTGVGTGLLGAPLGLAGYLAALTLILRELVNGPIANRLADE